MKHIIFLSILCSYVFSDAHIFVYHRFGDNRYPTTNTTIKELKKEFEYFKQHNYKVVSLQKIISKINKKEEIPSNWIALTIDDGYKSFYTNGLKLFKQYNYPFSLYVYVKATDKKYNDFMTWKQLKEISKYGEIGLHSYSHAHLTHLSNKNIYQDTKKAYEIFTKKLGFTPKSYAYPYGEYNNKVQKQISQFNFNAILTQDTSSVTTATKTYKIPRIALVGKVNIEKKLKYKSFQAKWLEPLKYPQDGVLKKIKIKVNPKYKKLKLYITGYGWRNIKVNNGIIDEELNISLIKTRIRLMIGPDIFTFSNKLIIKRKGNVK
jgi:peptidoglycan/xylan/chitin deacetylase (PgdA/CDA1 family)